MSTKLGPDAHSEAVDHNFALTRLRDNIEADARSAPAIAAYNGLFRAYVSLHDAPPRNQRAVDAFTGTVEDVAAIDPCAAFIMASCAETNFEGRITSDQRNEIHALTARFARQTAEQGAQALDNPAKIESFFRTCCAAAVEGINGNPDRGDPEVHAMEVLVGAGVRPSERLCGEIFSDAGLMRKYGSDLPSGSLKVLDRLENLFRPTPG